MCLIQKGVSVEELTKCEHWDCPYQTCKFHDSCKGGDEEERYYFPETEDEMRVCQCYCDL